MFCIIFIFCRSSFCIYNFIKDRSKVFFCKINGIHFVDLFIGYRLFADLSKVSVSPILEFLRGLSECMWEWLFRRSRTVSPFGYLASSFFGNVAKSELLWLALTKWIVSLVSRERVSILTYS